MYHQHLKITRIISISFIHFWPHEDALLKQNDYFVHVFCIVFHSLVPSVQCPDKFCLRICNYENKTKRKKNVKRQALPNKRGRRKTVENITSSVQRRTMYVVQARRRYKQYCCQSHGASQGMQLGHIHAHTHTSQQTRMWVTLLAECTLRGQVRGKKREQKMPCPQPWRECLYDLILM